MCFVSSDLNRFLDWNEFDMDEIETFMSVEFDRKRGGRWFFFVRQDWREILSLSLSFITDRSMKIGCGHCFQSDSNERSIRGYRYFEKSFGWSRSREGDSKINLGKSWTSSNRSTIFALMKDSSHLNDTRMQRWLESIVELVRSIISASDPMPACCWSTFSAF